MSPEAHTELGTLPDFEHPPLVETATSVQFAPLSNLSNAMIALLWHEEFREGFPRTEDAEPLETQHEQFDDSLPTYSQFMLRFGRQTAQRLQMLSCDKQWMIQLQNGRLVFNWRKLGEHDYPRWHQTTPRFAESLAKLRRFCTENELGEVLPEQWEVTYANHLIRGKDWDSADDWPVLLPGIFGQSEFHQLLRRESGSADLHFEIRPKRGRLHLDVRHGTRADGDDSVEVLVLRLTARGTLATPDVDAVLNGLNLGRTLIVSTFAHVTGAAIQKRWGRRDVE